MYESIAMQFIQQQNKQNENKILVNNQMPFFINSLGKAFISPQSTLDMSDFAIVSGIPRATSHICRKMFVNYLYTQKNALLLEAEEVTLW